VKIEPLNVYLGVRQTGLYSLHQGRIMYHVVFFQLEAVYLFAEGDSSELSKELLRQKLTDAPHVLHTVSFNATKTGTVKFLKEISEQTKGRFVFFFSKI